MRYALVHSDALTQNRIDIQLKSIDLKDAHSEILPTVQLVTRYYLVRTDDVYYSGSSGSRWQIQFNMTNWNPYLALLKIKSQGIMVDIAKISHFDKISDTTANIARIFYSIHCLEKSIRGSKQILALVQDKLNFAKSKNDQGKIDPLEFQTMQNDYRAQQIKVKSLKMIFRKKLVNLRLSSAIIQIIFCLWILGTRTNQILNGFKPNWITFADIQGGNLRLKIAAKKEQMQSNAVTGRMWL